MMRGSLDGFFFSFRPGAIASAVRRRVPINPSVANLPRTREWASQRELALISPTKPGTHSTDTASLADTPMAGHDTGAGDFDDFATLRLRDYMQGA